MLDEIQDVLLGDSAAGTGAGHFCEIDIVLAGELADERGGAHVGGFFLLFFFFFFLRWSAGGGRRSGSLLGLFFW